MMCKSDGGALAEIDTAAENTFVQAHAEVLGGKRLLCLMPTIKPVKAGKIDPLFKIRIFMCSTSEKSKSQ